MQESVRFPVKPYVSDGGFLPTSLPAVFAGFIVIGALVGLLARFIGQWFYLILLFPLGIGLITGVLGSFLITGFKVRSRLFARLAAALGAIAAVGAMHYFQYHQFQQGWKEHTKGLAAATIMTVTDGKTDAPRKLTAEELNRIERGPSFFEFLEIHARRGVSIGRASSSGGGANLGHVGTWIYWGVELLVIGGIAALMAASAASEPFCTRCETWMPWRTLGVLPPDGGQAVQALQAGEVATLATATPTGAGHQLLSAAVCKNCGANAPIVARLHRVTKNAKGEEQKVPLASVTYPGEALAALERSIPATDAPGSGAAS
jgi:hypothetical protein